MFKLSNGLYDVLKWVCIILLPAFGALWAGLAQIWNLPYPSEIPATVTVACTFLGSILCISTAEYNKTLEAKEDKKDSE